MVCVVCVLVCMEGGTASAAGSMVELEWQCPSCTLLNKSSSFKCRMCGTPKGTSTRQLKCHSAAIEKQYVAESLTRQSSKHYCKAPPSSTTPTSSLSISVSEDSKRKTAPTNKSDSRRTNNNSYPTLSNIDRSTGRTYRVTVDTVTTVITEYDFLYPPSD